jgi:hypothetical protein
MSTMSFLMTVFLQRMMPGLLILCVLYTLCSQGNIPCDGAADDGIALCAGPGAASLRVSHCCHHVKVTGHVAEPFQALRCDLVAQ